MLHYMHNHLSIDHMRTVFTITPWSEIVLQIQEAKALTKDSAKLKEEVESRDVRIKWLQNKMKQEADSYKVRSQEQPCIVAAVFDNYFSVRCEDEIVLKIFECKMKNIVKIMK